MQIEPEADPNVFKVRVGKFLARRGPLPVAADGVLIVYTSDAMHNEIRLHTGAPMRSLNMGCNNQDMNTTIGGSNPM